jgi:hypothetical protein
MLDVAITAKMAELLGVLVVSPRCGVGLVYSYADACLDAVMSDGWLHGRLPVAVFLSGSCGNNVMEKNKLREFKSSADVVRSSWEEDAKMQDKKEEEL